MHSTIVCAYKIVDWATHTHTWVIRPRHVEAIKRKHINRHGRLWILGGTSVGKRYIGGGKCPLAGRCCCHMAARFYFHSTVICLHFKIRREKNYIVAQNIKSCVNNTTTPTIPIDAAANAQPKCLKCRGTLELIKNSNMLSKFNQNDRRKKMGEGMRWWRRCCQFSWIDFFRKCITDSVCWPNVSGFDTTLLVVCACVRS